MTLIENYNDALQIQHQQQMDDFRQHQQLPIAERVLKGHSMINLMVDFEFYDSEPDSYCAPVPEGFGYVRLAHVHTFSNMSSFREGSSVLLSRGGVSMTCEVVQDAVRHFVLQPSPFHRDQSLLPTSDTPRTNWRVDEAENAATFSMLQSVGDYLHEHTDLEDRISRLLDGRLEPSADNHQVEFHDPDLNDSQCEAVRRSLNTDYIHLIQGPPGTGKTFTIARLCQTLVGMGSKVLVSGPTHTAINNCLDKAAQTIHDSSKVVKLGEKYQASEILDNHAITRKTRLPMRSYLGSPDLSQEGLVVGATPYALCYPKSRKLDGWLFDYAVVDEASQMSIPMAVAVLSKCRKVIFVGDHQQLSPIIPSDTDNAMFRCSIFQLLADLYPRRLTLLDVSYRLNAELLEAPNQLFYHGRLHSDVPVLKPFASFKSYGVHSSVLTSGHSSLLYLHDEFDGIGHSPYEAGVVAEVVSDLLNNGVPLHQIGILTPFRAQVREIRRTVYERGILDEKRVEELFVDTVDRMQGQERDYVLYSIADCNPLEHEDRLEFVYDHHRLNVAVTRARVKTIVISNHKYFSVAKQLLSQQPSSQLRAGLEAAVGYYDRVPHMQFDPLDDTTIWQ